MTTKQANLKSITAENGNGSSAPEKRELTKEEHLQKANKAMRKAWKMIYEDNQQTRESTKADV